MTRWDMLRFMPLVNMPTMLTPVIDSGLYKSCINVLFWSNVAIFTNNVCTQVKRVTLIIY